MKLKNIAEILEAELLACDEEGLNMEISTACGADLMSDVLAFTKENTLLLTGLAQIQVIRTAEMMDLNAVIFVRGKVPDQSVIKLAEAKNIPLLMTKLPLFEASGRLYANGIKGSLERK
ncbi:MAG: hypothetical protein KAX49_03615 [Halanaerobiales bacterium]|nr:hypothetical protein [Halanaerobiales bacterium]